MSQDEDSINFIEIDYAHFRESQAQKRQQQASQIQDEDLSTFESNIREREVGQVVTTEKYEYFHQQNLLILMRLGSTQIYKNDLKTKYLYDNLKHYYYASDFSSHRTRVIYKCSKRQASSASGRIYSWTYSQYHKNRSKMVGLQSLPKWVRAALASEYYFDVDIVNAHPSILRSVINDLLPHYDQSKSKNLVYYCQNRDKVLDLISHFLGQGSILGNEDARREAKQLATSLFFGAQLPTSGVNIEFKYIQNHFHLDDLVKEIKEIGHLLLKLAEKKVEEDEKKEELIPLINSTPKSHYHIMLSLSKTYKFLSNEWKTPSQAQNPLQFQEPSKNKIACLLASFLQDLERKVMDEFERALNEGGREVDVYIHDGCLIRKLELTTTSTKKLSSKNLETWDFNTLVRKKNRMTFETQWTNHELIEYAEKKINSVLGLELKFLVRKLDTSEFERRLDTIQLTSFKEILLTPPLKSFEELFYHYETIRSLCYITRRNKFLFGTELMTKDQLKDALDESYFQSIKFDIHGANPKEVDVSFMEVYLKRSDRARVSNIELVKPLPKNTGNAFQQDPGANPFKGLDSSRKLDNKTGGGKVEKSLYLLDLSEGWPLFFSSETNTSLERADEFYNYILDRAKNPFNEGISCVPLFPPGIIGDSLLNEYPLAVPYFNHWYLLLREDKTSFEYVVLWIAKIANSPGDMSNICGLVFYSQQQGIGKSLAIKMTMSLFAPFTQETQSIERLFDKFSDLMEFVLLLHIEDAPPNQLEKYKDELKGRMTAEKLFVEKKNHPVYSVSNFCRYDFLIY